MTLTVPLNLYAKSSFFRLTWYIVIAVEALAFRIYTRTLLAILL